MVDFHFCFSFVLFVVEIFDVISGNISYYVVFLCRCIDVLMRFLHFIIWQSWNFTLSTIIGIC